MAKYLRLRIRNFWGRAILLKGEPYTVIGVLPEGATTPLNADVYTALQPSREGEGGGTNFEAITRLRDGATWQEADAEINRAWSHRANRYELEDNPGAQVTYYSVPLQKGETATLRPQVLTLMLAAGLILLIACANLAGLTLVRMLRRTPEVATRLALGASRWQIQKQLWIENLLLALVGGAAGVAVGFVALRGLLLLLPEHFLPVASVPLDGRVLAFTLRRLASDQRALRHASRRLQRESSTCVPPSPAAPRWRRPVASAAGIDCGRGGSDRRAAGRFRPAHPHPHSPSNSAAGIQPNGVMTARASLDDVRYHDPAAFQQTAQMRARPPCGRFPACNMLLLA